MHKKPPNNPNNTSTVRKIKLIIQKQSVSRSKYLQLLSNSNSFSGDVFPCPERADVDYFKCTNGMGGGAGACVNLDYKQDGLLDCPDYSDECKSSAC